MSISDDVFGQRFQIYGYKWLNDGTSKRLYKGKHYYIGGSGGEKDRKSPNMSIFVLILKNVVLQLDDDSERKVVKMLLRLLEDKNGEVQNLAVRWYVFSVYMQPYFQSIYIRVDWWYIKQSLSNYYLYFSLGPLVGKVKDYQVEVIVDTLCNNMVGDKEQLRDISSIGLKTVINELPLTTQTLAATGNKIGHFVLRVDLKTNILCRLSEIYDFLFLFE